MAEPLTDITCIKEGLGMIQLKRAGVDFSLPRLVFQGDDRLVLLEVPDGRYASGIAGRNDVGDHSIPTQVHDLCLGCCSA